MPSSASACISNLWMRALLLLPRGYCFFRVFCDFIKGD
jgi:hypothetical protein